MAINEKAALSTTLRLAESASLDADQGCSKLTAVNF
jgi:hypothetical protein